MTGIRAFFSNIWGQTTKSDFQKSWDFERSRAARFGPSHVNEIDTIFSRHLEESR